LRGCLDDPNQIESVQQISFSRNGFSAAVPALASVLPADTPHEASV
jgi:hypothetical protein